MLYQAPKRSTASAQIRFYGCLNLPLRDKGTQWRIDITKTLHESAESSRSRPSPPYTRISSFLDEVPVAICALSRGTLVSGRRWDANHATDQIPMGVSGARSIVRYWYSSSYHDPSQPNFAGWEKPIARQAHALEKPISDDPFVRSRFSSPPPLKHQVFHITITQISYLSSEGILAPPSVFIICFLHHSCHNYP